MSAISFSWLAHWLTGLFAAPEGLKTRPLQVSRFGIGFCPGCKRLRGVASLRCADCGSANPVIEDA